MDKALLNRMEESFRPESQSHRRSEQFVLVTIMLYPDTLSRVATELTSPDCFSTSCNQTIYAAMLDAHSQGFVPDVAYLLDVNPTKSISDITEMITSVEDHMLDQIILPSTGYLTNHLHVVKESYRRRLIQLSLSRGEHSQEIAQKIADLSSKADVEPLSMSDSLGLVWESMTREEQVIPYPFRHFNWATDGGMRRSNMIVIAARPNVGKCLGKGTKVLMFDGSMKPVEDIQVGDLVMGDDSTPRRVLSLARGREQMYRVYGKNEQGYVVNESHILSLKRSKNEGKHKYGDVLNISVHNYLKKPAGWKARYRGYRTRIDFQSTHSLKLDPYILGYWLGNGDTNRPRITTADPEPRQVFELFAADRGLKLTHNGISFCVTTGRHDSKRGSNTFLRDLRSLGVFGDKHIPQIYKTASREDRYQLLAGLLDSDGYLGANHYFEFSTKTPALAEDVQYLARSLGFKVKVTVAGKICTNTGAHGIYYRLTVCGEIWRIPTKVPRKQCPWFKTTKSPSHYQINVQPLGEGDYYGFTLDGNHLFVLEDFTVTHNTSCLLQVALHAAKLGKKVLFVSAEMSEEDLATRSLSIHTQLSKEQIRASITSDRVSQSLEVLTQLPLDFYYTTSLAAVETKIKGTKPDLVAIDYMGLMIPMGRFTSSYETMTATSKQLQRISREHNLALLVAAQYNRNAAGGQPQMSDIKDSGQVEQDADLIISLWEKDPPVAGMKKQVIQADIIKNRHGPKIPGSLLFDKPHFTFYDMEKQHTA